MKSRFSKCASERCEIWGLADRHPKGTGRLRAGVDRLGEVPDGPFKFTGGVRRGKPAECDSRLAPGVQDLATGPCRPLLVQDSVEFLDGLLVETGGRVGLSEKETGSTRVGETAETDFQGLDRLVWFPFGKPEIRQGDLRGVRSGSKLIAFSMRPRARANCCLPSNANPSPKFLFRTFEGE